MLAWLTAMAMLGTAALATGCGSEETSSSKAETSAAETEEAADAADDAEVDELAEDDADAEDGDSVDDANRSVCRCTGRHSLAWAWIQNITAMLWASMKKRSYLKQMTVLLLPVIGVLPQVTPPFIFSMMQN